MAWGQRHSREMTTKVPALWGLLRIRQGRRMLKQIMMELPFWWEFGGEAEGAEAEECDLQGQTSPP